MAKVLSLSQFVGKGVKMPRKKVSQKKPKKINAVPFELIKKYIDENQLLSKEQFGELKNAGKAKHKSYAVYHLPLVYKIAQKY